MKKCLVVGGAGFVGAALVCRLIRMGVEVHILDDPTADLWRLHDKLYAVEVHRASICDEDLVKSIVERIRPNVIFNISTYGRMFHHNDVKRIRDVNFFGTVNLLKVCQKIGFDCFITTGSSGEYGFRAGAIHEDMALWPQSHYGVTKASATHFCVREAITASLPIYVVRPFVSYGDYEPRSRLIGSIFASVLKRVPVFLLSPEAVRDFIYIEDLVDMYLLIARRRPENKHVFNAGTGVGIRVKDVVKEVGLLLKMEVDAHWEASGDGSEFNDTSRYADISRARKYLGWQPSYTLREGLGKTFKWFSENFHMYESGGEREFMMSIL